jgi:serine/threonine-protein kinase
VYVRAFPDQGTRWLISNGGGTMPVWSVNGRELFYRTEDDRIMVATYVTKGATFAADRPKPWSEKRLANTGLTPSFDLAPDGRRFAVLMPGEPRAARGTNPRHTRDELLRRAAAARARDKMTVTDGSGFIIAHQTDPDVMNATASR